MRNLSQKQLDKVRRVAEKAVNKVFAKKVAKMPLEKQVGMARVLCKQAGLVNFRSDLLSDGGLPADIKEMVDTGKNAVEIKEFYWSCPAFVKFWADIDCTEEMLDLIIKKAAEIGGEAEQ